MNDDLKELLCSEFSKLRENILMQYVENGDFSEEVIYGQKANEAVDNPPVVTR